MYKIKYRNDFLLNPKYNNVSQGFIYPQERQPPQDHPQDPSHQIQAMTREAASTQIYQ